MDQEKYAAKLRFAEAFVDLTARFPPDKITVGLIVEHIGKSRKTFYYHFADRNRLIEWLFRYDLACDLTQAFPHDVLVYEPPAEGALPDMPFYVRNLDKDGFIFNAEFFDCISQTLEKRRPYYRILFSHVGSNTLDDYLHRLYTPCLRDDILFLVDRELSEWPEIDASRLRDGIEHGSSVDFLAEFYTGAFISRLIRRLHDAGENRTIDDIRPFENIIHDSLRLMISANMSELGQ